MSGSRMLRMVLDSGGAEVASDPDWWARGIAAAAAALSSVTFASARLDSRWKRRHAAMEPLRDALQDLRPAVLNANDPQQVQYLFSVAAGSHLQDLEDEIDKIPDRRFRAWLSAFVEALNGVRGARQPDAADGTPAPLSGPQLKKLSDAQDKLGKIMKRLNTAVKKGGA